MLGANDVPVTWPVRGRWAGEWEDGCFGFSSGHGALDPLARRQPDPLEGRVPEPDGGGSERLDHAAGPASEGRPSPRRNRETPEPAPGPPPPPAYRPAVEMTRAPARRGALFHVKQPRPAPDELGSTREGKGSRPGHGPPPGKRPSGQTFHVTHPAGSFQAPSARCWPLPDPTPGLYSFNVDRSHHPLPRQTEEID